MLGCTMPLTGVTHENLAGILASLHGTDDDLDRLIAQEVAWHIDQSGYSDGEKAILKMSEPDFISAMRAILLTEGRFVNFIGGNDDHGLVDYWVKVRKLPHASQKAEQLKTEIWGPGKGEGSAHEGEPDDPSLSYGYDGGHIPDRLFVQLNRDQQAGVNAYRAQMADHPDRRHLFQAFRVARKLGVDNRMLTTGFDGWTF